ncbi:MAG: ABC transporter substrate-binding protein [Alphaproteobacteria bacterium]|nr:ABC transporter substrate-binding protein [Alphaproteobacteria bacterium]
MTRLRSASRTAKTLAAGFVVAVAAGFAFPADAQKVLRVVPHSDLRVLDGYQTTTAITTMHMAMVYDTLFSWDAKMEAKPDAVGSWSVTPDNLKYTFTPRPGLKFHDGSPVTAKDAVASTKRLIARESLGRTLEPFVASIEAVDDKTMTLTLKEPFGFTTFTLSGMNNAAGIMRAKEASIDPATPVTEAIGSGPFKFPKDQWNPGARAVYTKNTDYVPRSKPPSGFSGAKLVKMDRVEYVVMPDYAQAYAALVRGEVDFLDSPSLDLVTTVDKDPNIQVSIIASVGNTGYIRMNHLHPPFNNVKARHALALAVDQTEYGQAAYGDPRFWKDTTPCWSLWTCGTTFGTEIGSEPIKQRNLERAKQLMIESGYKGEKVTIIGATDIGYIRAQSLVTAENLKKIGVNVDLVLTEWGNVVARRAKKDPPEQGGWNIFHTSSGGSTMSLPFVNIGTFTLCDASWFGWPCDAEAEKMRQTFMREPDAAKRKQLADNLHKYLWENVVPFIPIGQFYQAMVHRKNVTGLIKANTVVYWNVDKS